MPQRQCTAIETIEALVKRHAELGMFPALGLADHGKIVYRGPTRSHKDTVSLTG